MRLNAYRDSFYDEESRSGDSFSKSFLYRLEENAITKGTINFNRDIDYYQLTVEPNYQYTISITSDASLYGWNSFRDEPGIKFYE